jgi:hypothetical protein
VAGLRRLLRIQCPVPEVRRHSGTDVRRPADCPVVFAALRPTRSVEYRPMDMRPPRALQDRHLGSLGASTCFRDRTPGIRLWCARPGRQRTATGDARRTAQPRPARLLTDERYVCERARGSLCQWALATRGSVTRKARCRFSAPRPALGASLLSIRRFRPGGMTTGIITSSGVRDRLWSRVYRSLWILKLDSWD